MCMHASGRFPAAPARWVLDRAACSANETVQLPLRLHRALVAEADGTIWQSSERHGGAGGTLADDAAGLGVADQEARQVAVRAAAAAAGHRLLALHGQLVHPVQTPLQTVCHRDSNKVEIL